MVTPYVPTMGEILAALDDRVVDETEFNRWLDEVRRAAKVEALLDAADALGILVDERHSEALNPDQWLTDRADRIEREGQE